MTATGWKDDPRQAALDLGADPAAVDVFLDGDEDADPWPELVNPLERKRRWSALRDALWQVADLDDDWHPAWDAYDAATAMLRRLP